MQCLIDDALAEALTTFFWTTSPHDRALVHAAIAEAPQAMGRIHLLCQLLYNPEAGAGLLATRLCPANTVRGLLAGGAQGIAHLECVLAEQFRVEAPREIFGPLDRTEAPALGTFILGRLLNMRAEDPDFEWRNPLFPDCRLIDRGDASLAKAILSAPAHLRSDGLRELILGALRDRAEIVRLAAAQVAAFLIDCYPVVSALAALSQDESLAVRRAALDSLAFFSDRTDVADAIAAFDFDPDPALRRRVVQLLLEDEAAAYCEDRLAHLIFDRDAEIAAIAQSHYTETDWRRYLRRLAHDAAGGAALLVQELALLAKPAYLDQALRQQVFRARLGSLYRFGDTHQLTLTAEALQSFATDFDDAFWRDAVDAIGDNANLTREQTWAAPRAKTGTRA